MSCWKMENSERVSVGTAEKEVELHFRSFLLTNATEDKTVYISAAGKATAAAGFPIPPKTVLPMVFTADTLSVVGSDSGAELRILYVDEG